MTVRYSIVMPALNEEIYLPETLDSLKPQLTDDTELIVVDNESTDRTAYVASCYGAKVISAPRGKLNARDAGIRAAAGEIIIATDADSRYPQGWLERIKHHFQDDSVVGVGGSRVYERGFHWVTWLPIRRFFGGNSAFRKKAYLDSGGFDLSINQFSLVAMVKEEELRFKKRLKQYGRVIIDRKIRIVTSSRRFTDKEFKMQVKARARF